MKLLGTLALSPVLRTHAVRRVLGTGAAAIGLLALSQSPAHAYSYESAISVGCHERITMTALRAVRKTLTTAPMVTPDQNDNALVSDVPYNLDPDMKDLTGATITIGARDNDLKGRGPTEVDQLTEVHGNPANQREHCLRDIDDDEPDGSPPALDNCKAFIREKVAAALLGLDANGVPDPALRTNIDVSLQIRGGVTASLPTFYVEIGRALHTMQDSFSHTFRSPDRMKVRTVLNWIEFVDGNEVESRDGPVHRFGLDQCDNIDDLQTLNIDVATQASVDLLTAVLDPTMNHDAKVAAVDVLLDKYIGFDPGCTAANGWCDAPERKYATTSGCGCSTVGAPSGGLMAILGFALGGTWLVRRRKKRAAAVVAALGFLALPGVARAQNVTPVPPVDPPPPASTGAPEPAASPSSPDAKDPPVAGVPTTTERKSEVVEEKHRLNPFGIYGAVSGSVTDPSFNGQLGFRLHLSDRWIVGIDGELNGWFGVHTKTFRTGAFNGYGTLIFRTPLRFESLNLRSTASLGASVLLIDLYGAPQNSVGIFAGLVPLGVEYKVSSAFYVIFDALGVAVAAPHLSGAPFAYPQYRSSIGVEYSF